MAAGGMLLAVAGVVGVARCRYAAKAQVMLRHGVAIMQMARSLREQGHAIPPISDTGCFATDTREILLLLYPSQ